MSEPVVIDLSAVFDKIDAKVAEAKQVVAELTAQVAALQAKLDAGIPVTGTTPLGPIHVTIGGA